MKRVYLFATIILVTCSIACNSSNESSSEEPEGLVLITQNDCGTCHNATSKVVGPAYKDIAAKYPATAENISKLADEIINGSSGIWSPVPMTPHAHLEKPEVEKMVTYILSLKNVD